ncbi:nitroreductase family protein [Saccharothrix obliqua]|uniref:nitroreductase family protein n=1 Tax=Saccharothrix obliqua TaxID=2861747 RepID=UPI001C5E3A3D|nr:nitroreductase family protein [Saccharothrix obliqua]MBW4721866.1 nitroreductase family protein [Saccharothrix obliqua]
MSLLRFWEATRLRAGHALPAAVAGDGPARDVDGFRSALALVLGRGCGPRTGTVVGKHGISVQARTTPSAGALYPFEVVVGLPDGTSHLYDVDTARIRALPGCGVVPLPELVRRTGLAVPPDRSLRAVVTLVARPWKAMVKYGLRGYLYTHLDIGHAASNIAVSARELGLDAVVHVRFDRRRLAETLALTDMCREPQVVVTLSGGRFDGGEPHAGAPAPVWHTGRPARLEPPDAEERANWEELREVSPYAAEVAAPRLGRSTSVEPPEQPAREVVPLPHGVAAAGEDFTRVALDRRSAKGFLPRPLTARQVLDLFADAADPADVDCADSRGVGVRVLVRSADGLAPGVYAYSPPAHALHLVGEPRAVTEEEVLATCMGQPGLRHAAAFVHLHVPVRRLLAERGRAALAEIHYHAAHVAQSLCLGAARHGVGITCIGGFDEVRCGDLIGLPEEDEVVYLLAIGVPDPGARKLDRDAVAYSHGRAAVTGWGG